MKRPSRLKKGESSEEYLLLVVIAIVVIVLLGGWLLSIILGAPKLDQFPPVDDLGEGGEQEQRLLAEGPDEEVLLPGSIVYRGKTFEAGPPGGKAHPSSYFPGLNIDGNAFLLPWTYDLAIDTNYAHLDGVIKPDYLFYNPVEGENDGFYCVPRGECQRNPIEPCCANYQICFENECYDIDRVAFPSSWKLGYTQTYNPANIGYIPSAYDFFIPEGAFTIIGQFGSTPEYVKRNPFLTYADCTSSTCCGTQGCGFVLLEDNYGNPRIIPLTWRYTGSKNVPTMDIYTDPSLKPRPETQNAILDHFHDKYDNVDCSEFLDLNRFPAGLTYDTGCIPPPYVWNFEVPDEWCACVDWQKNHRMYLPVGTYKDDRPETEFSIIVKDKTCTDYKSYSGTCKDICGSTEIEMKDGNPECLLEGKVCCAEDRRCVDGYKGRCDTWINCGGSWGFGRV
ncbi:MAG: hypothetical protein JXB14_03605, partial [Candidatus Altiarchaeota archaeon]|nr:hypothetical protein [Candidatus Altiarchaeota archaeon]